MSRALKGAVLPLGLGIRGSKDFLDLILKGFLQTVRETLPPRSA